MTASAVDTLQREAADAASSVWVAASAGTGKTKVLTDRVLSLMLGGSPPTRILCLTFTRAAAAEMANRLHERLSRWAVLPEAELRDELAALRWVGLPDRGLARRRPPAVRDRARCARRPRHRDHSRLLPVPAAKVSRRGRRAAAFPAPGRARGGRAAGECARGSVGGGPRGLDAGARERRRDARAPGRRGSLLDAFGPDRRRADPVPAAPGERRRCRRDPVEARAPARSRADRDRGGGDRFEACDEQAFDGE